MFYLQTSKVVCKTFAKLNLKIEESLSVKRGFLTRKLHFLFVNKKHIRIHAKTHKVKLDEECSLKN